MWALTRTRGSALESVPSSLKEGNNILTSVVVGRMNVSACLCCYSVTMIFRIMTTVIKLGQQSWPELAKSITGAGRGAGQHWPASTPFLDV